MEQRRNILKGLIGGATLWAAAGAPVWARAPFQSPRIVVETRGSGPDLILIPGLASTSAVWTRTAARLPDRRLHLVSVRGFGDLAAGANGYILKKTAPGKLLESIRELAEGGAPMSSQIARQVVASFRAPAPTLETEGEALSERENEVLGYLTKNYSGKEIADRMGLSVHTVKSHLQHIYQKLHVRSRNEILVRFLSGPPAP